MYNSIEGEINQKLPLIIREAGKIASSFFANNTAKEYKKDNTIVTQADAAVQEYIVDQLKKIEKSIPIIAEEDGFDTNTLNNSEYIWIIDPIDGTSQYANDLDNWVIAIALLKNCNPFAGWIYQPILDKLYYAPIGDSNAYIESKGKPSIIPKISKEEGYSFTKKDIICYGSRTFSEYKLKRNNARIQCLGSLTLHAIETVVGHSVGAFSFDNKIWDICAVAEIAKRTNVDIKYVSGKEVNYKAIIISKDRTLEDDMIISHKNVFHLIREHLTRVGEIGKIQYISKDGELADAACDILEAIDEHDDILMLSKQARWFKSRLEGNKVFSERQIYLENKIENLARTYDHKIYSTLNYKVILTENPMTSKSKNTESIKLLIRAGADVRYLPNYESRFRMLIGNNKIFVSYAESNKKNAVVNKGFLYSSSNDNPESRMLFDLFHKEFYKLFKAAKPLTVSDKDKIIYSNSFGLRTMGEIKRISLKDVILALLSAAVGFLLSLLLL